MTNSILITGASGLIGSSLTEMFLQKGCRVSHLGRRERQGSIPTYRWDPYGKHFDEEALNNIDTIIHLAGAGIADKRWSAKRKQEIIDSRVRSTSFLAEVLKERPHQVKTVVAASGIGYYGPHDNGKVLSETDAAGSDFLAEVVVKWENEIQKLQWEGIRVVTIRIGIVLSMRGGALPEIIAPLKWGFGAPLGSGKQVMSWIHMDDLCEMFAWAVKNETVGGIYNAAAPEPVSNREFTRALGRHLLKPVWLPPVPGFALRLFLGEMADLVLNGCHVSGLKAMNQGFRYRYENLNEALAGLPLR